MKVLQYAVCGLSLTLAAAAQSTPPPTAPASNPTPAPATASRPVQLSNLGADEVKGPEHPLTLDQMKELYDAMGYGKQIEQSRAGMIAQQRQRAAFIPSDVWDDLDTTSKKIDYVNSFYDVYKKYISTEDASKLIEFAKTPAGKDFLDNIAALTRETSIAVQKQQQQAGVEVQSRHKDEIEAAVKKYREEHQPKPAPSLGPTSPASPSGSASPSAPASTTPSTPPASTTPSPSTTPHN